ncbi:hypothetical protein M3Y99_01408500 [Aphelenchoides fujianensis]|nr:hypothetical protein M3Y99_01408500 [Aphelenchoides fujianensis]
MGAAIALAFAKEGASLMLHGRNEKGVQTTIDSIHKSKAANAQVDFVLGPLESEKTLKELVKKTVDRFKRIDVLVNAAGVASKPDVPFDSMENFKFVMDVNCRAPTQLSLLCVPHLQKTKGQIINISSIASTIPATIMPFYSMTKAALEMFTKNYAIILAPKGIRVNCLVPGVVRTGFQEVMLAGKDVEKMIQGMDAAIPVGRVGTPQDMADAILYIANAPFMTGTCLLLDGGFTLKH